MTIDEAIRHCEEVAEARETEVLKYNYCRGIPDVEKVVSDCKECAAEHRQLAEWLAELKEAKRLLKMAVEDLTFESQCRNCKYQQTGLDNICNGCRGNKYEWRYADETKKLLSDEKINNVE